MYRIDTAVHAKTRRIGSREAKRGEAESVRVIKKEKEGKEEQPSLFSYSLFLFILLARFLFSAPSAFSARKLRGTGLKV